ncbi:MAG: hypothetical protein MJ240_03350 [Kiritimatiellae bacterium]|nr:hypothetical protein [Kiritimatiellia bacterium]
MTTTFKLALTATLAAAFAAGVSAKVQTWGDEKFCPRLFKQFGDVVNLPDGLTQDKDGNIYMSAPNLIDKSYAGVVMKRCFKTGKWSVFAAGAISPKTGRGCPMGIEYGPDGNIYYCDNQYFLSKDYASRIMRIVVDPKTKEALRIETVVENIKLANAIRFFEGDLFFTDTYFDLDRKDGVGLGGVYRVPMSDCRTKKVSLMAKPDYKKDPYFVCCTETVALPGRGGDNSGADGLAITDKGDLYFGTFGSGRFYTAKRQGDGSYAPAKLIFEDPARFPCCDGICFDPVKNRILMTDSAINAVHVWDIAKEKAGAGAMAFGELWKNADTDGADGLLDQPCEPLIWKDAKGKRQLVIVNFDMAFPGLINTVNDSIHTLSVIDLD